MDIKDLKEGITFKSYRDLCKILNWEISSGSSKVAQFKELERYCKWEKDGNKIIIGAIYDEPKQKVDNRKNNKGEYKEYEQLKISYKDRNNIGIYYIIKDNDIYIGSTISGFRSRFQDHYYGYDELMQHTYELLQNGGSFNILYDMTDIKDEVLIRQVENEYIQYFKKNTNYNVINRKENAYSITERTRPLKNKIIRISEDKYEQAMQLLIDNGLVGLEKNEALTNIIF